MTVIQRGGRINGAVFKVVRIDLVTPMSQQQAIILSNLFRYRRRNDSFFKAIASLFGRNSRVGMINGYYAANVKINTFYTGSNASLLRKARQVERILTKLGLPVMVGTGYASKIKHRNAFARRSYRPRRSYRMRPRSYGFRGLEGTGTGCCCAQELAMSGFGQAEEVAAEVTTKKSPALQNMIATAAVGTIVLGLVWGMGKSTVGRAY